MGHILMLVGFFVFGILGVQARAEQVVEEVTVPVMHVYAPLGFDSNDDVEVIVYGYLPDLCYKSPRATATWVNGEIQVEVKALRIQQSGVLCAQVAVPFLESAHAGVMPQGLYDILVNPLSGNPSTSQIDIDQAMQPDQDNHLYANVDLVEKIPGGSRARLQGYHPSDCFEMDRVEIYDNGKDTFSVLPILKKVRDFCPRKMVPFTTEVDMPRTLPIKKPLLHVRSMRGKSVNALFDNGAPSFEP